MSGEAGGLDVATRFRTALEHAAKTGDWTLVYPRLAPDVEWVTPQRTLIGIDEVEHDLIWGAPPEHLDLEFEVTDGLGWIGGEVRAIAPKDASLKIPHMGWNTLKVDTPHALLDGIDTGPNGLHAYFVHSYHLAAKDPRDVVAETDYGGPVTSIVAKDNIAGTQFHPEKSQTLGLKLIANFLTWQPS